MIHVYVNGLLLCYNNYVVRIDFTEQFYDCEFPFVSITSPKNTQVLSNLMYSIIYKASKCVFGCNLRGMRITCNLKA